MATVSTCTSYLDALIKQSIQSSPSFLVSPLVRADEYARQHAE
jgi:hypothetical protein